jgi:hypothetical protein
MSFSLKKADMLRYERLLKPIFTSLYRKKIPGSRVPDPGSRIPVVFFSIIFSQKTGRKNEEKTLLDTPQAQQKVFKRFLVISTEKNVLVQPLQLLKN